MLEVTDEVPGTPELIKWFGYWPSFHDAEVLDVKLNRTGNSTLRVHTFDSRPQVNSQGSFICTNHVIVSFAFDGITNLLLGDFNEQNVISELHLRQTNEGYELSLEPCYGLRGTIAVRRIRVEFEPGIPLGSQYLKLADA